MYVYVHLYFRLGSLHDKYGFPMIFANVGSSYLELFQICPFNLSNKINLCVCVCFFFFFFFFFFLKKLGTVKLYSKYCLKK